MNNPPTDEPVRIPIGRNVTYAVRGMPEVANEYGPGYLVPTEVSLTYRAAEDSQLGRFHAYVKGHWRRDGEVVSSGEKLPGQHYYGDPSTWPAWLAEEARLHDPAAVPAGLVAVPPTTTDQAAPASFALWLDASDGSVPTHDGVRWPDGTATLHHRHFGYTTTHHDPEAARQAAHGEQGRIVWPERADAVLAVLPAGSEDTTTTRADARVRALHQQYRFAGDDTTDYCSHCNQISGGWIPWPCPTVQALDDDARRLAAEAQQQPETGPDRCSGCRFVPCGDCCPACSAGIEHTEHCPTPESHNWGCGCPGDQLPLHAESGVDTPGCDCGHNGMGPKWHAKACAWLATMTVPHPDVVSAVPPQPEETA